MSSEATQDAWPKVTTPAVQIARVDVDATRFNQLVDTLKRVPDFDVYEYSESIIYITSKSLISAKDSREIEAGRIRDIVFALAKLEYSLELKTGSLCELLPNGKVLHSLSVSFTSTSEMTVRLCTSHKNTIDPARLVSTALMDQDLQWILYLYTHLDNSWGSLYKLYEAVKFHAGDRIFEVISKQEEKAFTGTANNPKVIGKDARHGNLKFEVPKKTMEYNEAKSLILRLVRWWLEEHM